MNARCDIRVRCTSVQPHARASGIRCLAQVVLDEVLFIDSLTVSVSDAGMAQVAWPERCDRSGHSQVIVRIFDPGIREAVERAVLAEAVRGGWLEPCRVQEDSQEASRKVAR